MNPKKDSYRASQNPESHGGLCAHFVVFKKERYNEWDRCKKKHCAKRLTEPGHKNFSSFLTIEIITGINILSSFFAIRRWLSVVGYWLLVIFSALIPPERDGRPV